MAISPQEATILSLIATLVVWGGLRDKAEELLGDLDREDVKNLARDIIDQKTRSTIAYSYLEWAKRVNSV